MKSLKLILLVIVAIALNGCVTKRAHMQAQERYRLYAEQNAKQAYREYYTRKGRTQKELKEFKGYIFSKDLRTKNRTKLELFEGTIIVTPLKETCNGFLYKEHKVSLIGGVDGKSQSYIFKSHCRPLKKESYLTVADTIKSGILEYISNDSELYEDSRTATRVRLKLPGDRYKSVFLIKERPLTVEDYAMRAKEKVTFITDFVASEMLKYDKENK